MFCKLVLIALIIYLIQAPLVKGNCSFIGGVCVKTKKCSFGEYDMQCEDQANKCCAEDGVQEKRHCETLGGQCISECPPAIVVKWALKCDEGLSCCIL